jgi:hypothetical protein
MKTLKGIALFLLLSLLPACGQQLVEFPNPPTADAGTADARNPDTRNTDTGTTDARNLDVAVANPDVGNTEARSPDVTNPDVPAANLDVGNTEARSPDVTNPDVPAANLDVGNTEARSPDVTNPDVPAANPDVPAANPDVPAANPDVPTARIDVRNIDAENVDVKNPDLRAANIDVGNIDAEKIDAENPDLAKANPDMGDTDAENIDVGPAPVIVIDLGLAAPFAIAATAGVTNTNTVSITHINGNVVLDPNKTCNGVTVDNAGGFGLCGNAPPTISGMVITNSYPNTTTSTAIKAALNAAFLSITPPAGGPAVGTLGGGTTIPAPTTLGDVAGNPLVLGDNWFTPGVYTSGTSILITGDVTLDGQGDPNAIFIFQSHSTLTTAAGAPSPGAHTRILLTNGAKASNVWWQVASSATIGLYSEFQGNILAAFDITMNTGATACGRSMAGAWAGGAGAFVFDSNVVSVPGNGCPL